MKYIKINLSFPLNRNYWIIDARWLREQRNKRLLFTINIRAG